jgi:hypothetical protein
MITNALVNKVAINNKTGFAKSVFILCGDLIQQKCYAGENSGTGFRRDAGFCR